MKESEEEERVEEYGKTEIKNTVLLFTKLFTLYTLILRTSFLVPKLSSLFRVFKSLVSFEGGFRFSRKEDFLDSKNSSRKAVLVINNVPKFRIILLFSLFHKIDNTLKDGEIRRTNLLNKGFRLRVSLQAAPNLKGLQ